MCKFLFLADSEIIVERDLFKGPVTDFFLGKCQKTLSLHRF